ncbi:MAG: Amuc_1100 family pilus-like protein [Puniceicoccales bacterium]|jgi:hypothetical protein|nr:Amuc_1100 family pilus-like protein [Puniceicoccales bacterium]
MENRLIRRYGLQLLIVAMSLFACLLGHLIASENRATVAKRDGARKELILLRQQNDGRNLSDLPWMLAQLDVDRELVEKIVASRTRPELIIPAAKISSVDEFASNLTGTIKRLTDLAEKFRVVLRGNGYFGFTEILQRGHVNEKVANRDNTELYEIAALLQLLFESSSNDIYFIGIERESTLPTDLSTCRNDFFDASLVPSFRKSMAVDSHIYRIRFRSKTDTFRNFFNALEENLIPVVPHTISVSTPRRSQRTEDGNRSIVVHSHPTEFSIILEWIQIPPMDGDPNPTAKSK